MHRIKAFIQWHKVWSAIIGVIILLLIVSPIYNVSHGMNWLGQKSSSSSSTTSSSTQSPAYKGGYTFGYAAYSNATSESAAFGQYYTGGSPSYACGQMTQVGGKFIEDYGNGDIAKSELPPTNGNEQQAWTNGCVAGFNTASDNGG